MNNDNKGKLKNKYLVCKRASAALTIAGFLTFMTASGASIAYGYNAVSDYKAISENLAEIRCSDSYQEYSIEEQRRLFLEYKSGNITADEFNDSLIELNTNEHVLKNLDLVATDEEKAEITAKKEVQDDKRKIATNMAVFGVGGGLIGFIAGLVTNNIIREKEGKLEDSEIEAEM